MVEEAIKTVYLKTDSNASPSPDPALIQISMSI